MSKKKNSSKDEIQSPSQIIFENLFANRLAVTGMVIMGIIILFVIIVPTLSRFGIGHPLSNINSNSVANHFNAPSASHWLGTDEYGRDIFTRLMYGGQISLLAALTGTVVMVTFGTVYGILSGFIGGKIDVFMMRIVEIFNAIPFLPIMIVLSFILKDNDKLSDIGRLLLIMGLVGILSFGGLARMIRGEVLSLRENEYILASKAMGVSRFNQMFKHILPNLVGIIIVMATLGMASMLLTEASLSFLGLGIQEPQTTWGLMIQSALNVTNLSQRLWLWVPPGIMIILTVYSINLIGDGLRDAVDPKTQKR